MGMLRAKPLTPVFLKYGIASRLAAITARESHGDTKKPFLPMIMLRSCRSITMILYAHCQLLDVNNFCKPKGEKKLSFLGPASN